MDIEFKIRYLDPDAFWTWAYWDLGPVGTRRPGSHGAGSGPPDLGTRTRGLGHGDPDPGTFHYMTFH